MNLVQYQRLGSIGRDRQNVFSFGFKICERHANSYYQRDEEAEHTLVKPI